MNDTQKNILKWEVIGVVIINIIFLVLCLASILTWGWFIGIFIISLFLTILIIIFFIFISKKKEDMDEQNSNNMSESEAQELAVSLLYDLKILEKVEEIITRGIRYEGEKNFDNVYEYTIRGAYSKKIISILVNMRTEESNIKFYDEMKIEEEEMELDISKRANKLSRSPEEKDTKTTTTEDVVRGIKQTVKEEIRKEKEEKEEKEEGLN